SRGSSSCSPRARARKAGSASGSRWPRCWCSSTAARPWPPAMAPGAAGGPPRDVFRLLLEHDGHRVETAASGAEGTDLALTTSPDVVLIDIGLPGLDGYGVGRRTRDALGEVRST